MSCNSNTSSSGPSNFSAHICEPVSASMSCPVMRSVEPAFLHAAFQHVAHAEFAPDLPDVDRPALVGERGIARDHEQRLEARQRGDDVLHHAVGKIFLLGIAAHVLERQHRDRRFVGERRAPAPARVAADGSLTVALLAPSWRARRAPARRCSSGPAARDRRNRYRPCRGFPGRRPPTCRCRRARQCPPAARRY